MKLYRDLGPTPRFRKADFTLMGFRMSLGVPQAGRLEWVAVSCSTGG